MTAYDIAAIAAAYLLGSVPFGLVLTRFAGLGDIRDIGSGNIGATNVLRTGRRDLALLTLFLDAGKGAIAVLAIRHAYDPSFAALAGSAAFLGHCFPVFLKFRGGKGVATFFGTLVAINPVVGLLTGVAWLVTAILFKMSSFAALMAALLSPIVAWQLYPESPMALYLLFMTVVIYIRHKDNIGRILKGVEPKIGAKKAESDTD